MNERGSIPTKWLVAGGIAGAIVVLLLALFLVNNSVTNEGNKKQTGLNAQYNDSFNYLSDCIVRIREASGIAKGQTAALDKIITDAVQGRYQGDSSAEVGQGQLFSAITEAYPNLDGLSGTFDKVLTIASGCRVDYRDMQTKMQRMIADFEAWRTGSFITRTFGGGFPDGNLKARKGEAVLRGDEALDQMSTVVLVREASKAQETHEVEPEDPFGSTSTTGR